MIPDKIKGLMQTLIDNKFEAYIIGGAVRDILLCEEPNDYDIFTNASGEEILKIFQNGVVIGNEERQERILTVVVDDVEISQYRKNGDRTETGNTLKEHQATCDFTINSMAMDIDEDIIDNHNGKGDLCYRFLKFVGNEDDRINEDKLRILRGIRFMCTYGMTDSTGIILDSVGLLKDLPKERIRDEIIKILSIKKPWNNTAEMILGVLNRFIPEIGDCVGMHGGDYHNENVETHMLNVLKESYKITDNPLLRLSCFLHDIGKGETQTFEYVPTENVIDGKDFKENIKIVEVKTSQKQTHFYEHEKVGCEMMEKRLEELKFSKDDIKYVTTLIRLHMYTYRNKPSKKSYIKFFNKLDEAKIPIEDYIMLIYCDHQGNMAKPRIKFGDFIKGNWLHKKYYEIKYSEEPMTVKDLKVSGKDVIEILKIKPGPLVGEILQGLFWMVMDGEIRNERHILLLQLKTDKIKMDILEEQNKKKNGEVL